jgi:NAD(P)-dependent dehydrogenase (short-subunit alcohol dehydrogenase family)
MVWREILELSDTASKGIGAAVAKSLAAAGAAVAVPEPAQGTCRFPRQAVKKLLGFGR